MLRLQIARKGNKITSIYSAKKIKLNTEEDSLMESEMMNTSFLESGKLQEGISKIDRLYESPKKVQEPKKGLPLFATAPLLFAFPNGKGLFHLISSFLDLSSSNFSELGNLCKCLSGS